MGKHKLQQQPCQNAGAIQPQQQADGVFCVFVLAEEHHKAHAGAGAQARHGRAETDAALQQQLGEQHRGGTVGDEANQPGDKGLKEAAGQQQRAKALLPQPGDDKVQGKRDDQQEEKDLGRVPQRRPQHAALLRRVFPAVAVQVLSLIHI